MSGSCRCSATPARRSPSGRADARDRAGHRRGPGHRGSVHPAARVKLRTGLRGGVLVEDCGAVSSWTFVCDRRSVTDDHTTGHAQVRRGHDPFAIAFPPDGNRYATLGRDPSAGATVEWWDAEQGLQLRYVELGGSMAADGSLDVDAAGGRAVVGGGALFVLDTRTGLVAARWPHHPE